MDDPWQDPEAQAWVENVRTELVPKLAGSAATISLVPSNDGDVKFWVELGASIMMDKPLIAIVRGDNPVPRRLALDADEIVRIPDGVDVAASDDLTAAIARVLGRA